jgi:hypothetical protein
MNLHINLLCAALICGMFCGEALAAPAGTPFSEAATELDGDWRGADFVLRVDARRAQASIDAARPFKWEQFLIKDVSDGEIVFAVGSELFEAKLNTDILTLTGTSFRGARVLFREANNLRGTTSE